MNILKFSLESSSDCRFDRLEIRNGGLLTSPLVAVLCGNEYTKTFRSFSNQMYLQFSADSSRNDDGFEIEWTSTATGCGGVLTSYRGSLTSPNFPESYNENAICGWRIAVNQGSAVQIIFTDLDLEASGSCSYDYVEIFDGKDASSKSLGRFCESDRHPLNLVTTTNFAFVRFSSDMSNQGRGFALKYSAVCNITKTGIDGVIESPNFPEPYPHMLQCEWIISGSRGNKIYLEFTHFDLEHSENMDFTGVESPTNRCTFDYVELVQYKNNDTAHSERYCNKKPEPLTSVGDMVIVRFVTDVNGRGSGWRLEWNVEGCGGRLSKPEGVLSTPNYPSPYPHGTTCEWQITTEYGKTIELTVNDLDIEHSTECRFDGLKVLAQDEVIAKLCHFDSNQRIITGHGHEMFVTFYSDSSLSYKGFNASYRVIENSE